MLLSRLVLVQVEPVEYVVKMKPKSPIKVGNFGQAHPISLVQYQLLVKAIKHILSVKMHAGRIACPTDTACSSDLPEMS